MENLYRLLAVFVLAFFYGIYFVKMLLQKKQGIKTNQIGSRTEKNIRTVEMLMSVAAVGIVISQLLSIVFNWSIRPQCVRIAGFFIGILGDVIFLVSVTHMKNSWRAGIPKSDKTELVTDGIYGFSRNPAFFGFDLMYIGVLLMYFNVLTALFTIYAVMMLHLQILQEERFLENAFGEPYLNYKSRVFRYLGKK